MTDDLSTTWPIEPHTKAKHKILVNYLNAWAPILTRNPKRTPPRFIDAFAGPGTYSRGEAGSPIIAIKALIDHSHQFPVPVRLLFIESRKDRHENLMKCVEAQRDDISRSTNVVLDGVICADCNDVLNKDIAHCKSQGMRFGPALVFLDQFGYSGVPMSLIKRILENEQCEVLTYFNYSGMNRFFDDPAKDEAKTRAFGNDSWMNCVALPNREQCLLNTYKENLRQVAGARYVWDFGMVDDREQLLYWLFFCTNHIKGLEVMKSGMLRVDCSGAFRFYDSADPSQLMLFDEADDLWLADSIHRKFAAQKVPISSVKEFVLTETPPVTYAKALQALAKQKVMRPLTSAKRPGYTKNLALVLEFEPRLLM